MAVTTIVPEPLRVRSGIIENAHFRFPIPAGWSATRTAGGCVVLGREDDELRVIRVEGSEPYRPAAKRLTRRLFGAGPMTEEEHAEQDALGNNCMGRVHELLTTHFRSAVVERDWTQRHDEGFVFAEHRARFPPNNGVSVVLRHNVWVRRGAALLATLQTPDDPRKLAAIERFERAVELLDLKRTPGN
jgi:hypothetical protein